MKTGKIKAPVRKGFLIIDQRIFKDLRGKWLILSLSAKMVLVKTTCAS